VNIEQFSCAGETGEMLRMKEPHDEGLASHIVSESCAAARKGDGEALTGGRVGRVLSREILFTSRVPTL